MSFARVQSQTGTTGGTNAASLVITLGASPTAGNLLAISFSVGATTYPGATLSQTGVTWTVSPQGGSSGTISYLGVGRAFASAGAALTITAPSSTPICGVLAEYPGTNIRPDRSAWATGTGTSAASGATATANSASELYVGAIAHRNTNGATFSSPTNSFSIVGQTNTTSGATTDRSVALLERIDTSAGTANAGATISASGVWVAQVMAFEEVASGDSGISRGRML